jgi:hypothetical protein
MSKFIWHSREAFAWHSRNAFSWQDVELYGAIIGAMCFTVSQPAAAFGAAFPAISMILKDNLT